MRTRPHKKRPLREARVRIQRASIWPTARGRGASPHVRWQLMAELCGSRRPHARVLRMVRAEFAVEEIEKMHSSGGIESGELDKFITPHAEIIFFFACALGYIGAAKWISTLYKIAHGEWSFAFRMAAAGGHLPILRWLDSMGAYSYGALKLASSRGHADATVWLILRYRSHATMRNTIVKHIYNSGTTEYVDSVRAVFREFDSPTRPQADKAIESVFEDLHL